MGTLFELIWVTGVLNMPKKGPNTLLNGKFDQPYSHYTVQTQASGGAVHPLYLYILRFLLSEEEKIILKYTARKITLVGFGSNPSVICLTVKLFTNEGKKSS